MRQRKMGWLLASKAIGMIMAAGDAATDTKQNQEQGKSKTVRIRGRWMMVRDARVSCGRCRDVVAKS